jgi:hypothetical protein
MKSKIKQKIILLMTLLLITCVSVPSLGLNFINQANADTEYWADEGGDDENCVKKVRVRGEETIAINRTGFEFSSGDHEIPIEGTKGGCEDASIWYACRTRCEINDGFNTLD